MLYYKQDKPLDGGGGVHFCAAACTCCSGLGPWIMVRSGDTAGAWRMACRTEFTLPPLVTTYTVQKSGAVLEMVLEISALNLHKPNIVAQRHQCLRTRGHRQRQDHRSPDEAAPGGGADDELLDGGVRGELDDRLGHVVVVQHHVLALDLQSSACYIVLSDL